MSLTLSALPVVLNLCASTPYIVGILQKRFRPSRSSWIVWSTLDSITLAGMLAKGSANTQIISGWLLSLLIMFSVLHVTKATPWKRREKLYLAGGAFGIVLWGLTSDPLTALITSLAVIECALVPTLEGVWNDPEAEPPIPWLLGGLASVPVLVSLDHWTLANALQPILWMTNNVIVVLLILWRRRAS